uniref:G_PROTEIN_RECEP_F1_2 domain-containing protein n=1 Tax=Macrostomum lignano TaxID=282301 RepID=A0A1I8HTC4_9PLAT
VFFIILYFPLYLSPFALTISSLLRCYCIKYPLVAKAHLTKRLDLILILAASLLALVVAVVFGALIIDGWSLTLFSTTIYGIHVYYGKCSVPAFQVINTDKELQFIGFVFMLVVAFFICFLNMLSATIIIIVLFQSKRNRAVLSMSGNEGADAVNMEARATARLLGMNVTLLLCFFFSRLLLVVSTRIDNYVDPISYVVSDRLAAMLFHIPYFTNSLFIAGLSRSFYQFLFPCIGDSKPKLSSSDSQRTF